MTDTLQLFDNTAHVNLEGKQYALLDIDLGEGVVRNHLLLALTILGSWSVVMLLAPKSFLPVGMVVMLWMAPPWCLTLAALYPDRGHRPRYALWLCKVRYLRRRHHPMVPQLGQRLPQRKRFLAPERQPGVAQPFTVQAEFVVLPDQEQKVAA